MKFIKKGDPHPDRTILRKWFGDLEVIEAKNPLRIQPSEADITDAVPDDPRNCVFSRACQRMWGSNVVVFFGTVAYVDLLDKDGKRHVERFKISAEGRRFIRAFDAKNKVVPKGFVLNPPRRSATAAAISEGCRKFRRRKALLKGKSTGRGAKRPKRKPTGLRLSVFRNGMGMAQFPASEAA